MNLNHKKFNFRIAELSDFDILAFSETWLHAALQTRPTDAKV